MWQTLASPKEKTQECAWVLLLLCSSGVFDSSGPKASSKL